MNDKIEDDVEKEIDEVELKRNWKEILKDGYVWTMVKLNKVCDYLDRVFEDIRPSMFFILLTLALIVILILL
jgi:hypothetical protein